jgi:hypothetical protein
LIAIDRVYRHIGPAPPAPLARRYVAPLAAILLFVLLVMPFAALDRYRRLPLHETLLGPYVLTTCRESVRAARHLDLGEEIVWDLDAPGWSWATSDAADMGRMRWYLRDGFGKWPWDTTAPGVVMEARTASFVLPALGGKGVTLALELSAKAPAHATIALNGRYLGAFRIEAARTAHLLDIPAERLIHGDNLAALSVQDGDVALRPRLHRITLRPAR